MHAKKIIRERVRESERDREGWKRSGSRWISVCASRRAAPLYRVCSLFRINYADVSLTPRSVASLIASDSIEFYTIVPGLDLFKKKERERERAGFKFL